MLTIFLFFKQNRPEYVVEAVLHISNYLFVLNESTGSMFSSKLWVTNWIFILNGAYIEQCIPKSLT